MCFKLINSKIKKLKWFDIGMIKLASMAFALMVAKLWEPLLSLEWHWYAVAFVLLSLVAAVKFFKK